METPSPSAVVSTPDQNDAPIPAPLEKPPGPPPPLVAGPPPTPAPAELRVVEDVAKPKRIEPPLERKQTTLGKQVERAINEGVRYLKGLQRPDGSWADAENEARTGTTSLITLALLTAGENLESPAIRKALEYLRGFGPNDLHSTYAIALQTMVFAAAEPERDQLRIANNVRWLERAQIKPGDLYTGRVRGPIPTQSAAGPATTPTPSLHSWGSSPPARWGFPSIPAFGSCRTTTG